MMVAGEAKCHTFDFKIKYKFLTSFPRPSDLTPAAPPSLPVAPFPSPSAVCILLFKALPVALFQ